MIGEFQPSSILDSAGPFSHHIENLWWGYFIVLMSVFGIVMIVLLFALLKRRPLTPDPDLSSNTTTERRSLNVVSGSVAITAVVLIGFLVSSVITGKAIATVDDPKAVHIQVTGNQWWWDIQYQDSTPARMVRTANEIHVPVGRPVILQLKSNDVIHSFWVPNLMGKRDLIPGKDVNSLLFQVDTAGTYRGQCAEFCGYQHAKMAFFLVAQSPEDFESWMNDQRRPAADPTDDEAQKGQHLFLTTTCVMCHQIRGTIAAASAGPDLTHVAGRLRLAGGTLSNTPQHLADWINHAQQIKPGAKMPSHRLSSGDLNAVVAYVETLK
jgi:cytochrome c oxidase subunit 2